MQRIHQSSGQTKSILVLINISYVILATFSLLSVFITGKPSTNTKKKSNYLLNIHISLIYADKIKYREHSSSR